MDATVYLHKLVSNVSLEVKSMYPAFFLFCFCNFFFWLRSQTENTFGCLLSVCCVFSCICKLSRRQCWSTSPTKLLRCELWADCSFCVQGGNNALVWWILFIFSWQLSIFASYYLQYLKMIHLFAFSLWWFCYRIQMKSCTCEDIKEWCCIYILFYLFLVPTLLHVATQFLYTGQLTGATPAIPGVFPNMFALAAGQVLIYVLAWFECFII